MKLYRGFVAGVFLMMAGSTAGAQQEAPLTFPEAVPPGPGSPGEAEGNATGQTPPVQQSVVPSAQTGMPATSGTDGMEAAPMADPLHQPGFQRDATPLSTEEERNPAMDAVPSPDPATTGSEINPDIVPDRRFETFDSDQNGTPEMQPMPSRDDTQGGTLGVPPGGYGIGGVGR